MKRQQNSGSSRCLRQLPFHPDGFTIVEMLVVILIIGVLASAAAPRLADATHQQRVRAAACRIAAELNLARHTAKTRGSSRTVSFKPDSNLYELSGMSHPDMPAAAYRVNLGEGAYPVTLATAGFVNADGSRTSISFDMYGRPSSDNQPLIRGTVTVQSDSASAAVSVDPVSGKAVVP